MGNQSTLKIWWCFKVKKEILKHMKKQVREKLGPVPPSKVVPSEKSYKRKPKHSGKNIQQEE